MDQFIPGQRWISSNESELGLGLILEVAFKRVTVLFLASNEKRIYASENAPLTRVRFSIGDEILSMNDDKFVVTGISENDGLITYTGKDAFGNAITLEEIELSHNIQFNKPQDRLFTGHIDPTAWFKLRYRTWELLREHQLSPVKGLLGGRTSLIRHQMYIAHEAANRIAPRIMLADEVGLGKTIEAGMILHQRIVNGLSRRVLIIVPESLLHQWLVEMLRRFNLRFSIFDEARCIEETGSDGLEDEDMEDQLFNPFLNEQCILCSEKFFKQYPKRRQQAVAAGWDMVIVDEAHHLQWSPQQASPEYCFVEQLGLRSPSLILLTATPEQLGKESHFARLRLLDPDRFHDFSRFVAEEEAFQPVAEAAKILLDNGTLPDGLRNSLADLLADDSAAALLGKLNHPEEAEKARAGLINALIDRHGTGRVLFRNSRQTVAGFPERLVQSYPLAGEECPDDLEKDPRFVWLVNLIRALSFEKALLICREAKTAIALEKSLKTRAGIPSSVFHEGMTIVERDRAAAYFADQDSSARVLVCSEIGSEGRNFQFVQHLVLFDLPESPDLLQQRIGRLDRIGQKSGINIHVPYVEGSEQSVLFRWFDEGLHAFHSNTLAASRAADLLAPELSAVLETKDAEAIERFIARSRELDEDIENQLQNGRDLLLEMHSCRNDVAMDLINQVNRIEQQGTLWPYLEDLFECYGVETEFHSTDCFVLRPGNHMRISHFPGLQDDGLSITINRQIALAREDLQFFTWEHPSVSAAMDLVVSSETGNAAITIIKHPQLKAGQFLLECLFVAEASAPKELQISRFFPAAPIRVLIDQNLKNQSERFPHGSLYENRSHFDQQKIVAFLNKQRDHVTNIVKKAEQEALAELRIMIHEAAQTMLQTLSIEIKRLVQLKKHNPAIKANEIEQLKDMTLLAHEVIDTAQLRLDAIRFLVTS